MVGSVRADPSSCQYLHFWQLLLRQISPVMDLALRVHDQLKVGDLVMWSGCLLNLHGTWVKTWRHIQKYINIVRRRKKLDFLKKS